MGKAILKSKFSKPHPSSSLSRKYLLILFPSFLSFWSSSYSRCFVRSSSFFFSSKMHRSASTCRASDEFSVNMLPQSKNSPGVKSVDIDNLPTYDPLSHIAKKETSRLKAAENAVHIIPIILILCAIVLWFFSNPAEVVNKGGSLVARIEGLKIYGNNNQTGSIDDFNNQTALQPTSEMDNLDAEQIGNDITGRSFKTKSE